MMSNRTDFGGVLNSGYSLRSILFIGGGALFVCGAIGALVAGGKPHTVLLREKIAAAQAKQQMMMMQQMGQMGQMQQMGQMPHQPQAQQSAALPPRSAAEQQEMLRAMHIRRRKLLQVASFCQTAAAYLDAALAFRQVIEMGGLPEQETLDLLVHIINMYKEGGHFTELTEFILENDLAQIPSCCLALIDVHARKADAQAVEFYKYFQQLPVSPPEIMIGKVHLAKYYHQTKDYEQALNYFNEALTISRSLADGDKDVDAEISRGILRAYVEMGDMNVVKKYEEEREEEYRPFPETLFVHLARFATILNEEGQVEMSEAMLKRVISNESGNSQIRYQMAVQLANIYLNQGKLEQADAISQEFILPQVAMFHAEAEINTQPFKIKTIIMDLNEEEDEVEFIASVALKKSVQKGNVVNMSIETSRGEKIAVDSYTVTDKHLRIRFNREPEHYPAGMYKAIFKLLVNSNVAYTHVQHFLID